MKIRSLKSTLYSLKSVVINLFNLYFINNTSGYSWAHEASYIPTCCISYMSKIPKSQFNNQYLKKKKQQRKKEKHLNWMENFKIESRYLKLSTDQIIKNYSVIVDQKSLSSSPCFKTRRRAFKTFSRSSFWNIRPSFWNTQPSFWWFKRKLKAWPRFWKAWPRVCVITQPMLSQPATVLHVF